MAKSESLRDKERDIETQAAYAGEGDTGSEYKNDDQYMIPTESRVDDMAVAERAVSEGKDTGGSSGPGISGGSAESTY